MQAIDGGVVGNWADQPLMGCAAVQDRALACTAMTHHSIAPAVRQVSKLLLLLAGLWPCSDCSAVRPDDTGQSSN